MKDNSYLAIIVWGVGSTSAYGKTISDSVEKVKKTFTRDFSKYQRDPNSMTIKVYETPESGKWFADDQGLYDGDTSQKLTPIARESW
jgi:hypothetical protein